MMMSRRSFVEFMIGSSAAAILTSIGILAGASADILNSIISTAGATPLRTDWFDALFPDALEGTHSALDRIAIPVADLSRPRRLAYFVAQCAHETSGFTQCVETCSGDRYEGREDLGNYKKGDGRRFKGRGWLQITGRFNYQHLESDSGLPVVDRPEILANADEAAIAAAWYWEEIDGNSYADRGNYRGLTRAINGGYNGYADRLAWLRKVETAMAR